MRTLSSFLILAALICAFLTAVIGFGNWHDQDPHVLGWFGASFALYLAACLLDLVDQ